MSELYVIRPMELSDIQQVTMIERQVFTMPWPSFVYVHEISQNKLAHMGLIEAGYDQVETDAIDEEQSGFFNIGWMRSRRRKSSQPIAAYGGVWMDGSSGHISVIASSPNYRRQGFGELMLIALIGKAITQNMKRMVLEVRVSNKSAQALYEKYNFDVHETIPDYYHDNGEDAYVMVTPNFTDDYFAMLRTNISRLRQYISFADRYSNWIK